MISPTQIVVICGPTAVGKTGLGIELCRRFNGEIISADSQQVYRGMDIGTAKEGLTGREIACHLVDVVDPDEPFDAVQFAELADRAIDEVVERKKLPVVVGGTGFYIKVLIDGLCEAPPRDDEIRAELFSIEKERGREALFRILEKEDPKIAARLNPNDTQRIKRAIEVKRLTGKSLFQFQQEQQKKINKPEHNSRPKYNALKVGLNMDRTELYNRINDRVDRMIEKGLVDEVKVLVSKFGPDIQSLKAVGYKEIVAHLKGEVDLEGAIDLTKRDTRRFAKRQLTWFKADRDVVWYHPRDHEGITQKMSEWWGR